MKKTTACKPRSVAASLVGSRVSCTVLSGARILESHLPSCLDGRLAGLLQACCAQRARTRGSGLVALAEELPHSELEWFVTRARVSSLSLYIYIYIAEGHEPGSALNGLKKTQERWW